MGKGTGDRGHGGFYVMRTWVHNENCFWIENIEEKMPFSILVMQREKMTRFCGGRAQWYCLCTIIVDIGAESMQSLPTADVIYYFIFGGPVRNLYSKFLPNHPIFGQDLGL